MATSSSLNRANVLGLAGGEVPVLRLAKPEAAAAAVARGAGSKMARSSRRWTKLRECTTNGTP